MYTKGDALINPAADIDIQTYCRIISMDARNRVLYISMENHTMQKHELINVTSYDEAKGLLIYEGFLDEISAHKAVVNKIKLIDERQRRKDVRVNVNIIVALSEICTPRTVRKVNNEVILEALNVSAGGVLLKTGLYLAEDDACLVFDLPIGTKAIRCKAQIVRKEVYSDCFLYGCKILNNENDKTELRRFVFLKQLENRKVSLCDICNR